MKRNLINIMLLSFTLLLGSCVKDNAFHSECQLPGTHIALSLDEMKVVETRSIASENERWITDAYVLVFGSDDKYKAGERLDVATAIANNGERNPVLTTELTIANGDKVVVICNSNCTFTTIPLEVETPMTPASTMADINTAFPSTNWVFDWTYTTSFGTRRIPMCGVMTFGTDTECPMVRAYVKVDLTLANTLTGAYASSMTDAKTTWRIYNGTMKRVAMIYNPTAYDTTPVPLVVNAALASSLSFFSGSYVDIPTTGHSAAVEADMTYMYEYPNATMASKTGAAALDAATWSKDRTCMIVKNDMGQYYRIDFYDQATGRFLDFLRNHHYQVTITRVSSAGYATPEEAVANPSSNIEYEIIVTGDDDNMAVSNGQYALTLDKDAVTVFGDNDDLLRFSLKTSSDAPINISTAVIDVVEADKTTVVSIPDDIRLNGVAAAADGSGNKVFSLGTLTTVADFVLSCSDVFRDNQAAIAALNGNFLRIRIGNITQYVPINVLDVAFYYGTANSIEQQPVAGTYSFDCTPYTTTSTTYAYQNTPDMELVSPQSAKMLWSDVASDHITGATVTRNGDKSTLSYTTTGAAGNAVVGIYDTADPADPAARLLWSFHIWISDRSGVTDQQWSIVNLSTATMTFTENLTDRHYTLMNRNLGATSSDAPIAANSYSNGSYGLMYQWGRKDPFVGATVYNAANGSAVKTMYGPAGTVTKTIVARSATTGTVNHAIGHPMEFITVGGTWTAIKDGYLWGGKISTGPLSNPTGVPDKSIYDPCPAGYRVPNQDAFSRVLKRGAINNNGFRYSTSTSALAVDGYNNSIEPSSTAHVSTNSGAWVYFQDNGSGQSTFLPAAGTLNQGTGAIGGVKASVMLWTNSMYADNYSCRCGLEGTSWNPMWYTYGATAMQLRCMKIE